MDEQTVLREALKEFSSSFGDGPMGIALSRPASWAKPAMCFANAAEKARRSRGEVCLGWMFQAKRPDFRPDSLGYLVATHHAVWLAPDRHLYDVTPYHPNKGAHPIQMKGGTLFKVDQQAQPVFIGRALAPLPLRYFAIDQDPDVVRYVEELAVKEVKSCEALYESLRQMAS